MPMPDPTALDTRAKDILTGVDADRAKLNTQEDQLLTQENSQYADLVQRRAPAIADYEKSAKELETIPPREQAKMPDPNLGPPIDPNTYKDFMYGMLTLAAIGAVGGRKHYEGAIEALAGSLQGFREGNMELAKEKKEQYEREFKLAEQKQKEMDKTYDDILSNKKLSLNMKAEKIKVAAASYEDWATHAAAVQHRFDMLNRGIDSREKRADMMTEHAERLRESNFWKGLAHSDKAAQGETGKLDDDTLHFMAKQYWAGDKSVMQNLGRGAQGAGNVVKLRQFIAEEGKARGKSPADLAAAVAEFEGLKAAERTAGVRGANVDMAVTEADNMATLVMKTSRAFPRGEFADVNRALKNFNDRTGSTESRNFGAAVNSFINAYARAVNPSGSPTVADKEHAREVLSTADSQEQVESLMSTLKLEMEAAQKSPRQVKDRLREGATGSGAAETMHWDDLQPK